MSSNKLVPKKNERVCCRTTLSYTSDSWPPGFYAIKKFCHFFFLFFRRSGIFILLSLVNDKRTRLNAEVRRKFIYTCFTPAIPWSLYRGCGVILIFRERYRCAPELLYRSENEHTRVFYRSTSIELEMCKYLVLTHYCYTRIQSRVIHKVIKTFQNFWNPILDEIILQTFIFFFFKL